MHFWMIAALTAFLAGCTQPPAETQDKLVMYMHLYVDPTDGVTTGYFVDTLPLSRGQSWREEVRTHNTSHQSPDAVYLCPGKTNQVGDMRYVFDKCELVYQTEAWKREEPNRGF